MKPASAAFLVLAILAGAMGVFAAFPELDLEIARRFFALEGSHATSAIICRWWCSASRCSPGCCDGSACV
jgi:hypothetical protein